MVSQEPSSSVRVLYVIGDQDFVPGLPYLLKRVDLGRCLACGSSCRLQLESHSTAVPASCSAGEAGPASEGAVLQQAAQPAVPEAGVRTRAGSKRSRRDAEAQDPVQCPEEVVMVPLGPPAEGGRARRREAGSARHDLSAMPSRTSSGPERQGQTEGKLNTGKTTTAAAAAEAGILCSTSSGQKEGATGAAGAACSTGLSGSTHQHVSLSLSVGPDETVAALIHVHTTPCEAAGGAAGPSSSLPPEKQAPAQRDPKRSHRRRQDSHRHTAGQGSHRHTGSHRHKSSHHRHTAGAGIPRVRTREAAPAGPSGPDTTAAAAGDDVVMKEAEPGTGSGGVNPGASTLEGTEQATTATTGGAQAQSGSHSHHHGTRRNVRSRYSNPEQGSGVSTAPPPSGLGAPPPPPPPPSQPAPAPPKAPRPPPEPAAATEPRQQQHPPLAQLLPQLQSCVLRRLVEVKFLDRRATWVVSDTETAELDRVAACALSASSPGFRPVLCQCDDCLELSQACHMVKRKREARPQVMRGRLFSGADYLAHVGVEDPCVLRHWKQHLCVVNQQAEGAGGGGAGGGTTTFAAFIRDPK